MAKKERFSFDEFDDVDYKKKIHKIKCPYCFKVFNQDEVHFRVSEATIDYAESLLLKETDEKQKEYIKKFTKLENIDDKYKEVWGSNKGGNPPEADKKLFYYPYVDQDNVKLMSKSGKFDVDERTGMISGISAPFDKNIKSSTRICPYCHNRLPANYGKHEQYFISVLGVSSSGKSVFIKQLIRKLNAFGTEGILSHIRASLDDLVIPNDDDKEINKNKSLPEATDPSNFKIPYFLQVTFNDKDNSHKTYDIVIYDIAGENLVINNRDPNSRDKFNFFAGFIKASDGIIMLIDPNQIVNTPLVDTKYPARTMIATLRNIFDGHERISIPTAITISKSDMLRDDGNIREQIENNNVNINPETLFENIEWDDRKQYFYQDIYNRNSNRIRILLNQFVPDFVTNVRNSFEGDKRGYFAVSALADGVDQRLIFDIQPNGNKIWDIRELNKVKEMFPFLARKISVIESMLRQKEQGVANAINNDDIYLTKEYVLNTKDYIIIDRILGDYNSYTTAYSIQQELSKNYNLDDSIILKDLQGEEFRLTINQLSNYILLKNTNNDESIRFDMSIIGYPSNNGNLESKRLEEPLFWIFSKLNFIEAKNFHTINNGQNRANNSNSAKSQKKKRFRFFN